MARKTVTVTITKDNRDKGKTFLVTEMPAFQAESWAMRALLALSDAGVEVPEDIKSMGMAAIAKLGLQIITSIDYETAQPLLQEMMDCVQIVMPAITRPLVEEDDGADIEEVSTRLLLRKAVFELHTGFLLAVPQSIMASGAAQETDAG